MTPALHDRDSRPTAITHQLGRPVTVIAVLVACTAEEGVPGTAQSPVDRQLDLTNTTVVAGDARRPLVGIADAAFIEGGVVIAERSSGRLQFYTQEGQLIRTAGGAGDGPGRFQRIGRNVADESRSSSGSDRRTQLLIIDDFGLSPLSDNERRDLLEVLEDRYSRRATLVTSQLPFEHWHADMGDTTFADAIMDGLSTALTASL